VAAVAVSLEFSVAKREGRNKEGTSTLPAPFVEGHVFLLVDYAVERHCSMISMFSERI
jgi:hypothetical protein